MPLLVTDGSTSRQQRTGVVWAEGKVTSDTGYVDMRFDTAISAGYGFFKLDLTGCLLYTSPSPRDRSISRMPSSA